MTSFKLSQKWDAPYDGPDNTYWVGLDFSQTPMVQHGSTIVLGRECSSLREIEAIIAELTLALDAVAADARKRLDGA